MPLLPPLPPKKNLDVHCTLQSICILLAVAEPNNGERVLIIVMAIVLCVIVLASVVIPIGTVLSMKYKSLFKCVTSTSSVGTQKVTTPTNELQDRTGWTDKASSGGYIL